MGRRWSGGKCDSLAFFYDTLTLRKLQDEQRKENREISSQNAGFILILDNLIQSGERVF